MSDAEDSGDIVAEMNAFGLSADILQQVKLYYFLIRINIEIRINSTLQVTFYQ